ncbi:MAG: HDIG domain-containing protein [Deltaproteobacteria bacterium]|nr:HDIG domain-containing protein [Deltaproteobacteria bacterium]MBW1952368.1 HDIG domain-containing protein [Deltaproteobacteria bacterium]MBW1986480.1 HDIG domain-containing protein [Deltaproteobacteria bacterium]MBW2135454.1 HDIG domain-containing protein [Deltaproteobacteria bacterium]
MPDKASSQKINGVHRLREVLCPWGTSWAKKGKLSKSQEKHVKILLLVVFSLLAALIIHPFTQSSPKTYKVGDVATENIKATADFLVEDHESTAQRRKELLRQVHSVYDLDVRVGQEIQERLQEAFEFMRQCYQEVQNQVATDNRLTRAKESKESAFDRIYALLLVKKPEFDRLLGTSIPDPAFYQLAQAKFSVDLEKLISQQVGQIMSQGIISDLGTLGGERGRGIVVRSLPSRSEWIEDNPERFLDLQKAKDQINRYCLQVATNLPREQRQAVCGLAQSLLIPNLMLNRAETEERKLAYLEELQPVYFLVKKGEMLVREGERITPTQLIKLQAQNKELPQELWLTTFLATALMIGLLIGVSYWLACLYIKRFTLTLQELIFLAAILLAVSLFNQGLVSLAGVLNEISPLVARNMVFLLPVALVPMLARIFIGLEVTIGMAFLAAIMTGLILQRPFDIFIYFVVGGLVGVRSLQHCRDRGTLTRAGLFVGLANLAMLLPLKLMDFPPGGTDLLCGAVFALGGGILTGILVTGLTPVNEMIFNFTSDIRLLELCNLEAPILRQLMVTAPGTYHHSIIVGNMVEAAAEAIGANPLLAKAAAYYHDIGKIKKPAYFVENQLGGENKHEKLAPSMSSLILISHVKDGVELARQNKVGDKIIDIIRQHHGTCFISYFYNKAKQQAANPQQVNIEDYRYPGPRPQTKEAGLVLLADQVEAASKTLTDPTPARINGLVQKIINNVFADGQLDECELTLKDLHQIAKCFIRILSGIFHQRIDYPAPAEKIALDKKKTHEDLDKQPAKKDLHKPNGNQEKNREDLKRLGIS